MNTIKNIKIMEGEEPLNIVTTAGKEAEDATTIRLLRVALNNPFKGKSPQGQNEFGYEGLEEMRIGSRILDKLDEADKAAGKGDAESFELEDSEYDLCKKYIPLYPNFLTGVSFLPFLEQFDGKK